MSSVLICRMHTPSEYVAGWDSVPTNSGQSPKLLGLRPQARVSTSRRGYTLNELLIVMMVLAALAAMAWPALQKPLARHRLWAAAKQMRAELVRTRLEAISQGQAMQFRYVPGAGTYRIEPLAAAHAGRSGPQPNPALNGGYSNAVDDLEIETADGKGVVEQPLEDSSLPKEISFAAGDSAIEETFAVSIETTRDPTRGDEALMDPSAALAEDWSKPIVFYPNGRATDAELVLVGERAYRIHLALRGVTGIISVGKVDLPAVKTDGPLTSDPATANPATPTATAWRKPKEMPPLSSSLITP